LKDNHNDDDKTNSFVVLTNGAEINHYRIISKIGEGGMGVVYLAKDTRLNRQVALKFLPPQLCHDEECRSRFKREAQAAAALKHPNIVTIHEVSDFHGRPFIVMEHIKGKSLRARIKENNLTINEAISLTIQICSGLNEAHNSGIVHRDIKPSNIVIDSEGNAKLLDFGLATIKGDDKLTKTGSTLGTIGYMSPEQVRGEEVDHRADLFSLGVILYEMITTQSPFKKEYEAATTNAILNAIPEPLARYKSDISVELQRIVSKLLEKDISLRYQSGAGIVSDLRKLVKDEILPEEKSKYRWNRYIVIGVFSVFVVMFGYYLIQEFYLESDKTGEYERKMLAVLPFMNQGSEEDEYFADGITDEITTNLAKLSGLGVISQTSSMQYKNSAKNIKQIGKELKVDYILDGTIRWDKSSLINRVRINPRLIRVSDDMHLWAESYDEVLNDVFEIQSSIAREVVTALDITLLQQENEALQQQKDIDPVAYDYYLRGKQYYSLERIAYDQIDLAMKMHEKAIKIAPDFAPGYAELGAIHTEMYWMNVDPTPERLDTAKYYIDQALLYSPNSSDAYQSLGWYYYHGLRDFDRAVEIFKHVLKLHPNNGLAISSIAWVYRRQGKWDAAIDLLKQAVRLDPRKSWYRFELGNTLGYNRNYEEALENFDRTIDLEPDHYWAYLMKSWTLFCQTGDISQSMGIIEQALNTNGRNPSITYFEVYYNLIDKNYDKAMSLISAPDEIYLTTDMDGSDYYYFKGVTYHLMKNEQMALIYYDSARVILEEMVSETPNSAQCLSSLAIGYAGLGYKGKAIRTAKQAIEIVPVSVDALDGTDHIRNMAIVYATIGEYDLAIAQLDYLLQIPSRYSIKWVKLAPEFNPLRDRPRFKGLIEKYEKNNE